MYLWFNSVFFLLMFNLLLLLRSRCLLFTILRFSFSLPFPEQSENTQGSDSLFLLSKVFIISFTFLILSVSSVAKAITFSVRVGLSGRGLFLTTSGLFVFFSQVVFGLCSNLLSFILLLSTIL